MRTNDEQAKARLHRLMDELDYYVTGKREGDLDPSVLESLKERYQRIWDDLSNAWIRERRAGWSKPKGLHSESGFDVAIGMPNKASEPSIASAPQVQR